jgi:hypothetical protein
MANERGNPYGGLYNPQTGHKSTLNHAMVSGENASQTAA